MKKIRYVFTMLIAIISLVALASCGHTAKVEIVNVTTMRTRIGLTIKVDDPDGEITKDSIVARLYDEDEEIVSTLVFNELAEKEENKIFDSLEENTTYRLVVKASVNDKSVTYLKQNYKTTSVGAKAEDPIIITNVEDFKNIKYDDDAYYKLDADLDFSDVSGEKTAYDTMFNKTTQFNGHLDGNGHKISGLSITNTLVYSGLFGYIGQGASVKNLTIDNVELKSTKGSELYLGVLAGCNEGTIENVKVSNVKITHEGTGTTKQYIGGLVGVNTNVIKDSSVSKITMNLRSRLSSTVGGFVGENGGIVHTPVAGAYVSGCSATDVEITSKFEATRVISKDEDEKEYIQYTGGFVGETRIDIKDSYAQAKITSTVSYVKESYVKVYSVAIGGFAGRTINGCKIEGVASAATINVTSKDAYSVNAGVIVGEAYDTLFKNCYGVLTGENGVAVSSKYEDLTDDIKTYLEKTLTSFVKNFGVVGLYGDILTETVSRQENVLFMLAKDASIITTDTETVTGYMDITGSQASTFDTTKLASSVANFINKYLA